jgi:hypothetical protein
MATRAIIKDKKLVFGSPLSEYRFFETAEGKEVALEIVEKPTTEMRKYFEGCLVPAMFYSHPHSGWENFKDAREVLKIQFMPGVRSVKLLDGTFGQMVPSLADVSKKKMTVFVEAITEWMRENGMPEQVMDSEEYLRWRDTNFTELVYPPLQRLKESYDRDQTK